MNKPLLPNQIIIIVLAIFTYGGLKSQSSKDTLQAHQNFKIGDSLLKKGVYNEAITYYSKASRGFEVTTNWKRYIESLNKISESQYSAGNLKEALVTIEKALQIGKQNSIEKSTVSAQSLKMKATLFKRTNKFDEALILYEKAIRIVKEKLGEFHTENASLYIPIGQIFDAKGNYKKARSLYTKAIELYNKPNTKREYLGEAYLNMAISYGRSGLYNKAIPYYKKGITEKITTKGKNHPKIASYYYNLGINYTYIGEDYLALQYQKKGLNILKQVYDDENIGFADFYYAIGYQYTKLNELNLAEEYYQKALQIYLANYGKEHLYTASLIADMGEMYLVKKEYDLAQKKYEEALTIKKKIFGNNHPQVFEMNKNFGSIKEAQNLFNEADYFYKKKLLKTIDKFGLKNQKTAEAFIDRARIKNKEGKYLLSIKNYHKAIIAATQKFEDSAIYSNPKLEDYSNINTLLASLHGKANAFLHHANASKKDKDLIYALSCYALCDSLINKARNSYLSVQDKISLQKKSSELYEEAIVTSLQLYNRTNKQTYLSNALYFSEKNKAQLLEEQLRKINAQKFAKIPKEKLVIIEETKLKLARLKSKTDKNNNSDQLADEIFYLIQKNDSLIKDLEQKYPKYHKLKYDQIVISIEEAQEKIQNNTSIIEYFVASDIIYAFVLSKENFYVRELNISKLNDKILRLHKAITQKDQSIFKKTAYQLYQELIQPLALENGNENLIIIPDGMLWQLNFDLLLTKNTNTKDPKEFPYLLKEQVVSYANSMHLFFTEQFENPNISKECLAFSFSDINALPAKSTNLQLVTRGTDDDLPGTRKEIKAISDIIDGTYFYDENSSETNFKKYANQYAMLHLALHGELDNKNPENSKLYFTQVNDSTQDSYLYNHELYALEIPAELAVLSACNTGSGNVSKGEGIMSLGRAFQYAGTKSLVLTNWEVSDATTPELMKNFYTNLKKGMSKPKALQQAKLQYLTTCDIYRAEPFYWGAFYLIGDVNTITLQNNNTYHILLIGSICVLGILLLFLFKRSKKSIVK